jgi:hypothetical protein
LEVGDATRWVHALIATAALAASAQAMTKAAVDALAPPAVALNKRKRRH